MPLTLIAYYQQKPPVFEAILKTIQQKIIHRLGANFLPYTIAQIHGTIIGLELKYINNSWYSTYALEKASESDIKPVDLDQLLDFLKTKSPKITVQFAGFMDSITLPNQTHPYQATFKFYLPNAVGKAWPIDQMKDQVNYPQSLGWWRKEFESLHLLHKYHMNPSDFDNEFFFVFGKLTDICPPDVLSELEKEIRAYCAAQSPVFLTLSAENCALALYKDTRLPVESTHIFPLLSSKFAQLSAHKLDELLRSDRIRKA